MLNYNNYIVENIKSILRIKNISTKELALSLNESELRILNWLDQIEDIPAYYIPDISKYLKVSYEKILNEPKKYKGIIEIDVNIRDINDFNTFFNIDSLKEKYIYRGQKNDWPLQTTYCRFCNLNRTLLDKEFTKCNACPLDDLIKKEALDRIRKESSLLDSTNKIKNYDDGALLAYLQHHNIPTPLLDWAYSPLVALYFAIKDSTEYDSITIYQFNLSEYDKYYNRYTNLENLSPGVSILQIPSENIRQLNQQGIFMFSWKCKNIESYFDYIYGFTRKMFLKKYRLYINEISKTILLKALQKMNISEKILFPDSSYIAKDIMMEAFFYRLETTIKLIRAIEEEKRFGELISN